MHNLTARTCPKEGSRINSPEMRLDGFLLLGAEAGERSAADPPEAALAALSGFLRTP